MEHLKISEISTVVRGSSPRPKGDPRYYGGNVPRLMVSDLSRDGMYVTPQIDFLTEEGAKKSRPMKKGDLIIAVSGNPGEPCILNVDACIHDGFAGLRNLNTDKVLTEYLYRFFKFNKISNKNQAVGAIYKNLNTDQIKALKIPLPPLKEQQRIAHLLDEADKLRQLNQQLIQKYEQLTQSLFLEMFGDPVTNKKNWNKIKLESLVTKLGDGIHGTPKYNDDGDFYFINGNNLVNGKIIINEKTKKVTKEEQLKHYRELNNNTVLVSINGTIGKVAFYNNEKVMLGKSACYFNLKNNSINKTFLYHLISSEYFIRYAKSKATGSTIKNVSLKTMRNFPVVFPPLDLQTQFAERVGLIEAQKQQAQEALQKSEDLFNSLLQEVFKG